MGLFWNTKPERSEMRTIKTARNLSAMNTYAKAGFKLLVKELKPSEKIRAKLAVIQDNDTGEISESGDFRFGGEGYTTLLEWFDYYPHKFPSPYAAYVLPQSLKKGEWCILEDLIEDYVGESWNQGDTFRLESATAKWNGKDFEIDYNPKKDMNQYVG